MKVKTVTLRNEAPLVAVKGTVSGSAHLRVKSAGPRATYESQSSTAHRT